MIDPATQAQLKEAIASCISADRGVLDALREAIRSLKKATQRIRLARRLLGQCSTSNAGAAV